MKSATERIVNHKTEFLKYLKSRFQLFHLSNLFFRDLHYGVISYLKEHGSPVGYAEAESIARELGETFERGGIFKKIDHQSWLLQYPEFALPRIEKKAS